MIQNLGIEIQRAKNIHQFRSIIYAVMAGVNLALSIVLCQIFGAVGSAIGTAISLVLANGIIMNVYYQKKCNIDIIYFWKEISKFVPGLLLPVGVGICMNQFIVIDGVISFLIPVAVYSLVYFGSMWFFSMNAYEKNLLRGPIHRLTHRGSRNA